jgi:hypothetical protein
MFYRGITSSFGDEAAPDWRIVTPFHFMRVRRENNSFVAAVNVSFYKLRFYTNVAVVPFYGALKYVL